MTRKPRLEDLTRIDVKLVIHDQTKTIIDPSGNKIHFFDEMVGKEYRLVTYINENRTGMSWRIEEVPIAGRIKNDIPYDRNRHYYIRGSNGHKYRHLYIDTKRRKIGTRHELDCIYTTHSIGKRHRATWFRLQNQKSTNRWRKKYPDMSRQNRTIMRREGTLK
jgi:hypothetical protein